MRLVSVIFGLCTLILSLPSNAAWKENAGSWPESHAVSYSSGNQEFLSFSLAKDAYGNSRFYISAYYSDANICSVEQYQGGRVHNAEVNGAAVKFHAWCSGETDQNYASIYMTPATDGGIYYVVNTFLELGKVKVKPNLGGSFSEPVTVTANGFTEAWGEVTKPAL